MRLFLAFAVWLIPLISWANTPRTIVTGIIENESFSEVASCNARTLYDSGTGTSIQWENHWLTDANSALSVDYGVNRAMVSSSGIGVLGWENTSLGDNVFPGHESINWGNRLLFNAAHDQIMDWQNTFFSFTTSQNVSLDWNAALLFDDTGANNQSVDWNARQLFFGSGGTSFVSVDWQNFQLNTNGNFSVDWGAHELLSGGNIKLQWGTTSAGILVGPAGVTISGSAANDAITMVDGHLQSKQTTAPTTSVKSAAGTSATCSLDANATDTKGVITLVTTATSPGNGALCDILFNKTYNQAPTCTFAPASATTASLAVLQQEYITSATTKLTMNDGVTDATGHTYVWNYNCVE